MRWRWRPESPKRWKNMNTVTEFDHYVERVARGDRLTPEEIGELAGTPDILSLGMLADTLRRHLHDTRVTFLRVAGFAFDGVAGASVPAAAREVRLSGIPASLNEAVRAIEMAKAL